MYENTSKEVIESQKKVTETLAELTRVSMENANLEKMLPVLNGAIATFAKLRAQFSQITQFFTDVSSLVKDVLKPQVDLWAKNLDDTVTKLAGVPVSSSY